MSKKVTMINTALKTKPLLCIMPTNFKFFRQHSFATVNSQIAAQDLRKFMGGKKHL